MGVKSRTFYLVMFLEDRDLTSETSEQFALNLELLEDAGFLSLWLTTSDVNVELCFLKCLLPQASSRLVNNMHLPIVIQTVEVQTSQPVHLFWEIFCLF